MKKTILLLIHFPVWVVALFFAYFFTSDEVHELPNLISDTLFLAFWLLSSFYIFYSYLVPKYLEKGKYRLFASYSSLFIVVIIPGLLLFLYFIDSLLFGDGKLIPSNSFLAKIIFPWFGAIIGIIFCGALGSFYRFGIDWFNNIHVKKGLGI